MNRRIADTPLAPWAALGAYGCGLVLTAVGWQKSHDLLALNRWSLVWAVGVALTAGVLFGLAMRWRRATPAGRRALQFAVLVAGLVPTVMLAVAELALRLLAQPTALGPRVLGATLPPTWPEIRAANLAILDRVAPGMDPWLTVVVPDPERGWSIGPSRATEDGLYRSSAEGIRSGEQGIVFGERRAAPAKMPPQREGYRWGSLTAAAAEDQRRLVGWPVRQN